jgi:hypothetical protein
VMAPEAEADAFGGFGALLRRNSFAVFRFFTGRSSRPIGDSGGKLNPWSPPLPGILHQCQKKLATH